MEHYALRLPAGLVPASPGMKVARAALRVADSEAESDVDCQVLQLIAFQSFHVYHYTSEQPRLVEAAPELMARNGWHYKHCEVRVAAVAMEKNGRVVILQAEDDNWAILSAETTASAQEARCEELRRNRLVQRASEEATMSREQGMVEGD